MPELSEMTIKTLRCLAREHAITNASRMIKMDLVRALRAREYRLSAKKAAADRAKVKDRLTVRWQ